VKKRRKSTAAGVHGLTGGKGASILGVPETFVDGSEGGFILFAKNWSGFSQPEIPAFAGPMLVVNERQAQQNCGNTSEF